MKKKLLASNNLPMNNTVIREETLLNFNKIAEKLSLN